MSIAWVNPPVGLGWIGLGRIFFKFLMGWDGLGPCDKHAVTVDWMPSARVDKLPPGHVWALVSGLLLKTDVLC